MRVPPRTNRTRNIASERIGESECGDPPRDGPSRPGGNDDGHAGDDQRRRDNVHDHQPASGFPGLVLAILGAGTFHLVEADHKKATFLREAALAKVFAGLTTIHEINKVTFVD